MGAQPRRKNEERKMTRGPEKKKGATKKGEAKGEGLA